MRINWKRIGEFCGWDKNWITSEAEKLQSLIRENFPKLAITEKKEVAMVAEIAMVALMKIRDGYLTWEQADKPIGVAYDGEKNLTVNFNNNVVIIYDIKDECIHTTQGVWRII